MNSKSVDAAAPSLTDRLTVRQLASGEDRDEVLLRAGLIFRALEQTPTDAVLVRLTRFLWLQNWR
jgi:hypothetical protein